jgi:hypothetical protein
MMNQVLLLLRILSASGGVLLLYMAFFLYENEEGKIQNSLENWWTSMDDRRNNVVTTHRYFLSKVSYVLRLHLDMLLGEKLFSSRATKISISYSLGSACILSIIVQASIHVGNNPYIWLIKIWLVYSGYQWIKVATNAYVGNNQPIFRIILNQGLLVMLILCLVYFPLVFILGDLPEAAPMAAIGVGILSVFGLLFDILFVALTRKILRLAGDFSSWLKASSALLVNMIAIVCMGILPCYLGRLPGVKQYADWLKQFGFDDATVKMMFDLVAASNVPAILVSSAFVFLTISLFFHQFFWSILQRPIYSLQRHNVIEKKKLLGMLGLCLLYIAYPSSLDGLAGLLKGIGLVK